MKKTIVYATIVIAMAACTQGIQVKEPSTKPEEGNIEVKNDMRQLYEKNLATLKTGIAAFENEKLDDWAATIADSALVLPAAYGASPTHKEDWKKSLAMFTADWDSIKLVNPVFLPGLDSATQQFDGSVRYYGQWAGVHKSGVKTLLNYYATYDFNKDNKVVSGNEFYDLGGLMNAVKPKK